MRGFSVKFYTDKGNWDLVGSNTPVFFIRDPLKFPDFIRTHSTAEVADVIGRTRESDQEDLFGSIARGDFPQWTVCVQLMPDLDAERIPCDPFDLTRIWPRSAPTRCCRRGSSVMPMPTATARAPTTRRCR